jgi:hypothetical protein
MLEECVDLVGKIPSMTSAIFSSVLIEIYCIDRVLRARYVVVTVQMDPTESLDESIKR